MAGSVIAKTLKIAGWTLVALLVAVSVLLVCAVKFLDSKYLAPMVEREVNEYIEGEVKIGNLRLGFNPHFPILGIELDNLSVISHALDSLTVKQRGHLPNYADSLMTLDHLSGALDIKRLLFNNELSIHDVSLRGLSVNIVIAHNGRPNYDVMRHHDNSTDTLSKSDMPGFRINHFSLEQPKEIRFYNAADSTSASVLLLTDAAVDGEKQPTYRLKLNGNVSSPKATLITNLDQISFGVNGKIYWNPSAPGLVALDEMELRGAFLNALVSCEIDFTEDPIARKGVIHLSPVAVTDLLDVLPDSIRREHRLYNPYFSTDAAIAGRFELTQPMNLTTDTIPSANIDISISPATLNYGTAHLTDLSLDMAVKTETNLPDRTTIDIRRFTVAGPGTQLTASATLATPITDPAFEANLEGKIDFRDLPPILTEKIPGYLAGVITADLKAKGTTSMMKPERLHHLVADGLLTAKNIYFLSADTTKFVEVGNAKIELDSKRIVNDLPLLKAKVDLDTATVLVSGIDLAFGGVSLGIGADNPTTKRDTTIMMPILGNLKVERFNIISITDSAGARIRDIQGPVHLKQIKGNGPIPRISTDLLIGSVSAGTLSDRFLINNTKVKATLYKTDTAPKPKVQTRKKSYKEREYTYISPAAVHKYVYYKRTHRKHHTKRVYTAEGSDNDEMLIWNLTPQFQRFLNEWKLSGTVNTNNARLLTPFFPLKNHISTLALRFNNDTVNISNISLRAGASDITMSGVVSNVRRAFTSKTDNDLKGNFSLLSDTIDINEISAGIFTGAAYASDLRHGKKHIKAKDDKTLASKLNDLAKKGSGKGAPVLIPVNIDANLKIEANRLLYSDVEMQGVGADLLVYDGGVNLHDLTADSDAGNLSLSALYCAPNPRDMHFGFGMQLNDFNIAKFVKMVPAIDSITPLMHNFSGMIGANIAATCQIDSGMNIDLPSLNAAIRITGDNLSFIDPEKYRTLGKWLGFKDKADNTIHSLNVEMTVEDGLMRVYPFTFNIDRYRLGIYGSNNIAMDFDYHLAVLKSPIPFKFGITVSGNPKKYKVRFGGAKFKEDSVIESVDVVNNARINLLDQIQGVFRRGVRNSRFAKLKVARPAGFEQLPDMTLSAEDSLRLIKEGLIESPADNKVKNDKKKEKKKKKHKRFWIF
ncbi:MAG: AsmA-like C-terminal region-containing protein [Muribaculaceae bacterium]|nr:AsmA-like C-terminal region-containing protein [Muribaculaceae bacterium]